jgi:hypothetical protein
LDEREVRSFAVKGVRLESLLAGRNQGLRLLRLRANLLRLWEAGLGRRGLKILFAYLD